MICKQCGKEIPDESAFCSHCGCDLNKTPFFNHNNSSDEQIPLLILAKQIAKHKIAVIVSVIIVVLAIGGFFAIKKHQEKKAALELLESYYTHILDVTGTYISDNVELRLFADKTAVIKIKRGGSRGGGYKGYWREKFDGGLIEINFSDSFEAYIGNKEHYCSTLYLQNNRLWESMSAIQSNDYNASDLLQKE
jgi:hypothetical protein